MYVGVPPKAKINAHAVCNAKKYGNALVQLSLWHCPKTAEELPSTCPCPSTQLQL